MIEDNYDVCWNCGTEKDGTPPPEDFELLKENIPSKPHVSKPSSLGVLIFSFGILIAFCLPWVGGGVISASYFTLARIIQGILNLRSSLNGSDDGLGIFINIILWVIPIPTVVAIIVSFTNKNNRTWGILAGIVSLLLCISIPIMMLTGENSSIDANNLFNIFGVGYYLTVIFSLGCIVTALSSRWPMPTNFLGGTKSSPAPVIEKLSQNNDAIVRLKKLDELKSQGFISASEYEQKRAEILKDI